MRTISSITDARLIRHRRPGLGRARSAAPAWSSSIEMLSGVRTNAMCPSRGGRLMVTPASIRRWQVLVNVVDAVGEVAEIAAAVIARLVPIVGELDLGGLVARRGEEDQREAALLIVHPPQLAKAEQLEEADRRVGVGNADHGVEIFHRARLVAIKARFIGGMASESLPA